MYFGDCLLLLIKSSPVYFTHISFTNRSTNVNYDKTTHGTYLGRLKSIHQISFCCDHHLLMRFPRFPDISGGTLHTNSQLPDHGSVHAWWRHQMETFPRYWPFVRGIHRSPVNSSRQWRGAWVFSLICVWINGWVNNREAGDLRRYRAHYDVTVMAHDKYRSICLKKHPNSDKNVIGYWFMKAQQSQAIITLHSHPTHTPCTKWQQHYKR